ncbi:MAG TPA: UvrD-helicase domain-containing protein [Nitrospinota bacterium]|nr:UvrD-helicase domain-containing protein [Nitrospinota bacterium]
MSNSVLEKDKDNCFPHFVVLKASAGSGKTHTLTKRYVQFLLSDQIPHGGLRNILAVTFSNNAAKEMKERILRWLKGVYLEEPDKTDELAEIISLNRNELKEKAGRNIDSILDNYSDFQVKTLDSFMTTVFKSSAIDFGYNPDFDILLDNDSVMEYAFNLFLRRVKTNSSEGELLKDIVRLVMESKSKSSTYIWEPTKTVTDEVKNIYRKLSSTGSNINIVDYSKSMKEVKNSITRQVERIESLINESHLERSMGSSYNAILESVKKKQFPDLIGKGFKSPPVKKPGKKDFNGIKSLEAIDLEWQKLKEIISLYTRYHALSYCNPYLKFYSAFKETLEKIKRQEGKIFIEDINKMLSNYMDSQIVPDVYFRIGETVFHYLIDEFQDTSPLQWANLYPLIDNSLSEGGSLFVVGDTKQSIYGFREADYRIMKEFETKSPFLSSGHLVKELTRNFRSRKKILDFNEKVFKEKLLKSDYSEAAQKSGLTNYNQEVKDWGTDTGYMEVCMIDKSDNHDEKEKIRMIIHEVVKRGYCYGDIAVLTSKNENVIRVSAWLNEMDIPFVPYSSLDVRIRKITNEIVSLLNFLSSPLDDLAFATFCLGEILFKALKKSDKLDIDSSKIHSFFFNSRNNSPLYKSFQNEYPQIWGDFFEGLFKSSGYLPLYDLVNEVLRIFMVFETFKDEEASLIKILEVIKDFEDRGNNNIKDFLNFAGKPGQESEWNINVPEGLNAVKVMTIHKAKGLGFPVVINLLYGEKLDRPAGYNVFSERDKNAKLVKLTKKIAENNPDLALDYAENKIRERVNRLNSLYVSFTRAKNEMYVIGVKGARDKFPFELLPVDEFQPSSKPGLVSQKPEKSESRIFTYHHSRMPKYHIHTGDIIHIDEKKRGEFIHRVLSYIEFPSYRSEKELEKEIKRIVEKVIHELGDSHSSEEIVEIIVKFLLNTEVKKYFLPATGRTIKNEQEFTDDRGNLLRMDRVIIDKESVTVLDFKTGKKETDENNYMKQLRKYMKILREVYPDKSIKRRGSANEWDFCSSEQTKKTCPALHKALYKQELTAPKKNKLSHSNSIIGVIAYVDLVEVRYLSV